MANLLCSRLRCLCRRLFSLFRAPRCDAPNPRQAYSQGLFHKLCLLTNMSLEAPGRWRGCRAPTCEPRPRVLEADLARRFFDQLLDIGPGAHVAGFFLAPDQFAVRVFLQVPLHEIPGEGIKLLKADQVDIANLALLLLFQEIEIDLAAAENDLTCLLGRAGQLRLTHQAPESAFASQINQVGHCTLVAQKRLWRHHHQRLANIPMYLSTQGVEVVRRSGAVDDLNVVFRRQLQEPLEARRRVLWPLPLIAVWKQHHQSRHPQPLGLGGDYELVDDDLGTVHKIAELRFPDGKRTRLSQGIAILIP